MHRPNVWTLRCSAFIITPDEGLIVQLVALGTLKQISFSLPPKMTPGRQARNFLTCRISNVRLLKRAKRVVMKLSTYDSKETQQMKAFVPFNWPTVIFPLLFPLQALVCPPYFEVLITTSTWRCCFRIWTQSLSIKSVAGLWGVGTQRLTVGQHRHSTVTAMGEDPQWPSSKLTVISLVDTLTCPGPAVSKKQANISYM